MKDTYRSQLDTTHTHLYSVRSLSHRSQPAQDSPKSTKKPPVYPHKVLDCLTITATLFESTSYLLDGLTYSNTEKIISAGTGYLTFILVCIIYSLPRNKTEPFDKKTQGLAMVLLLTTWGTSMLSIYADRDINLLLFVPVVSFKAILFIHYNVPILIIIAVLGLITVAGIVVNVILNPNGTVFQYLNGIIFFMLTASFLLFLQKTKKEVSKPLEKGNEPHIDESAFNMFGILEEAVMIVNELGHPVYYNNAFQKVFPSKSQGQEGIKGHFSYSLVTEFQKITAVKAKDPELQNRIADILRSDQNTTPRVSDSVSRRILRFDESPDSLLIADKESSLNSLFHTFLNSEKGLKNNNIGFDCGTRLPKFESFTAVMKRALKDSFEIEFNLAYIELAGKTYLTLLFHVNYFQGELKEAQKETEFRKQMLRYVAHDMRNPISSNQLLLEAAESDPLLTGSLKEMYIRPCLKSLKYLSSLVNDLVDAAQIAAGKFKLVISEVFLNEVIDDVLKTFEIKSKAKDISLIKMLDSRLPLTIFTDPARLTQILINLVSNALKYSPRRGIITIKVDSNILNPNKIDFSVEDTGLGIRMEDQKNLLKDFGRVEGTKDPELNPYGVGLGLSISNKLAMQLNIEGSQEGIKIDSVLGRGTKMKFSVENRKYDNGSKIPIGLLMQKKLSENYSASLEENPVSSPCYIMNASLGLEAQKAKKTLTALRKINEQDVLSRSHQMDGKALIIDDDAFSAESLAVLLRSLGVDADKTYSTKEALKKLEKLKEFGPGNSELAGYDVIFMDGMMEDMDGFESTKVLKNKMKDGVLRDAPIVFCTGLDIESEPEARTAGASFYLTKPISKATLMTVLREVNIGTFRESN